MSKYQRMKRRVGFDKTKYQLCPHGKKIDNEQNGWGNCPICLRRRLEKGL